MHSTVRLDQVHTADEPSERTNARCKVCDCKSTFVFKKTIRLKYEVSYFRCTSCHFMQTETPYWLPEVYNSKFDPLDPWQIWRPWSLGMLTENLIIRHFDPQAQFVDFGGGTGLFVRIMRDRGFDFYHSDKYASNIFAQCFEAGDRKVPEKKFELATCFEVLEHLENPLKDLTELFSLSNNVFCSTQLQPRTDSLQELESWGYLGEIGGGHISFYTRETLQVIAERFNARCYSNGEIHLFTKSELSRLDFKRLFIEHKIKRGLIYAVEHGYRRLMMLNRPKARIRPRCDADFATAEQLVRERLTSAYAEGRTLI